MYLSRVSSSVDHQVAYGSLEIMFCLKIWVVVLSLTVCYARSNLRRKNQLVPRNWPSRHEWNLLRRVFGWTSPAEMCRLWRGEGKQEKKMKFFFFFIQKKSRVTVTYAARHLRLPCRGVYWSGEQQRRLQLPMPSPWQETPPPRFNVNNTQAIQRRIWRWVYPHPLLTRSSALYTPDPQPSTPTPIRTAHSSLPYIIPCVALGLLSIVIIAVIVFCVRRQRRRQQYPNVLMSDTTIISSTGSDDVLWQASGDTIRSLPTSKKKINHITAYMCLS